MTAASSSSSGNLATAGAAGAATDTNSDNNNAAALERQFLFEAGSGIRRPASTGIVLGGGSAGNHDSLTLSGAGVASAEVLKSLGLETPGHTSSASNNHGIGMGWHGWWQ